MKAKNGHLSWTPHTPWIYFRLSALVILQIHPYKEYILAWSATFYSPVPIFPHLSSPIFHTPYQLLRVGSTSHTLSLIYPRTRSTLSPSLPSPLSLSPTTPAHGARPTASLVTTQGPKAGRVLPPRRRSTLRLSSLHPPPLPSAVLLPAPDLSRRCSAAERSRKAARRLCATRE
jgi:hypothetical protein